MRFDYPHTCSDINEYIHRFKLNIERHLSDMFNECDTSLEVEEEDRLIELYADRIYSDFEYSFENVRDTNKDMRDKAEEQIAGLERTIERLEETVVKLEETIEES